MGCDLDHERNLSQAGKHLTLGGIKGPCVRHGVGTQEGDDLSPLQVAMAREG